MNIKKFKWILFCAFGASVLFTATKVFSNYWDGNDLLSGNIIFTVCYWGIAGSVFGFYSYKYKNPKK